MPTKPDNCPILHFGSFTKAMCEIYEEDGAEAFDDWFTNKVCEVETLGEMGFAPAACLLDDLHRGYNWVISLYKETGGK